MQQSSHHACRVGCRKTQALPRTRSSTSKDSSPRLPKSAASRCPMARQRNPPPLKLTPSRQTTRPRSTASHRIAQSPLAAHWCRRNWRSGRRTRSTCGTRWQPTPRPTVSQKSTDVFLHKFHGLFYVAPNQDSFMLRLRLPGGILSAYQAKGLADIAERFGGGNVDITTRANLQIREIGAAHPLDVLTALDELGLTSRGAGADNIRNLTGSPLAGIDPQELIDTRPLTRGLYHYILNHRELYGLPRKFNIAFDGGGRIGVLEDTNDIGFAAVKIGPGKPVPEGVYFRMLLGGLTGHGNFAQDSGVLLEPGETVAAAAAIVRVFIDHGDRTDRKKARLKYLIERWGLDTLMSEAARH